MSDEQVKGIPEDLREHYEECGKYQNAHLILCRQLIERIARSEQALAALEVRNRELESALERIASDFEMDFVIDGQVVDEPYRMHEYAWRAARAALKGA